MVKLPKFAYDWMLTAKGEDLSLTQALDVNYTNTLEFDNWIDENEEHIRDFAIAWCEDDVEIISDMYRAYYVDTVGTRHYVTCDYNASTDKRLAVLFTKSKWKSIFPKSVTSDFLQLEKVW